MKNTSTESRATVSPKQSTRITGFGIAHTYKLLQAGAMPHIKVGKKFYIPRVALERWLENCGATAVSGR